MKKLFLIPALALAVAACSGQASLTPQEKLAANDAQIDALIAQMSLEEKVEMLHSKTNMSSAGNIQRLAVCGRRPDKEGDPHRSGKRTALLG